MITKEEATQIINLVLDAVRICPDSTTFRKDEIILSIMGIVNK